MDGTLRCRHCGEVIGAYEPMIVLRGGEARRSSRAAEREAGAPMDECYHDACYAQAQGEDPGLE
jgi:hypothetical protein